MPKNSSWGANSKAVEAKARKNTAMKAEQEKKQKEAEDAMWADDDKSLAKKQNRKDDKEKKRLEQLERKKQLKQLEEEESAVIGATKPAQASIKITQAQIAAEREKREAAARKAASITGPPKTPKPAPIEENINRLTSPDEEARTVDEALKMLAVSDDPSSAIDKHPERRMKAAYNAFEEARLPQVKAENPSLRLTQLKQIIFTEWKKHPDNPMNQQERASYDS